MAEFTRDQIARISSELLIEMEEAQRESRYCDKETLSFIQDELAKRAIGQSGVNNSAYLSYNKQAKDTYKDPQQD